MRHTQTQFVIQSSLGSVCVEKRTGVIETNSLADRYDITIRFEACNGGNVEMDGKRGREDDSKYGNTTKERTNGHG